MPSQALEKRDWVPGTVYLIQFPRSGCIPSISPFSLKLETWLRMVDIPYENISNQFKKYSAKKQAPFIELDGRQIADSNEIIEHLIKEFKKEDLTYTAHELAEKRAFTYLLEQSIFWCTVYNRSRDNKWMATEQGFLGLLSGVKKVAFKSFGVGVFRKKIEKAVYVQGYGRHSSEEIEEIACGDLDALSTLLGDNEYFFKNTPTSFDATAFGQLAQIVYSPMLSDKVKNHLINNCTNLENFVARIKAQYWPDWDKACEELSLHTAWKTQE